MPQPIHLRARRALPPHLQPPAPPAPETDEERRTRQLGLTRELTDLNMIAARAAAARIVENDADPAVEPGPAAAEPTLALARATRAVTGLIGLETRIAAGERAAAFSVDDPRAVALRRLLHPLADQEPDPARRRALRDHMNERIGDALDADLDDDIPLGQIAFVIAREHGLELDLARIPDEYLESPDRRPSERPGDPRAEADPDPDLDPDPPAAWPPPAWPPPRPSPPPK